MTAYQIKRVKWFCTQCLLARDLGWNGTFGGYFTLYPDKRISGRSIMHVDGLWPLKGVVMGFNTPDYRPPAINEKLLRNYCQSGNLWATLSKGMITHHHNLNEYPNPWNELK